MPDYKSLLIENRKEKIQESLDKTSIKMSKTASKHSVKIYRQKLRQCRGTMFKKMDEGEQKKCVLKAMRSYCKAFLSSIKDDYVKKCNKASDYVSCQMYIRALIRQYEAKIDQIDSKLAEY